MSAEQSNFRVMEAHAGKDVALGEAHKWFQQPSNATSLQEILQMTQRRG